MLSPSFLPVELKLYDDSSIENDEALFNKLVLNPKDLLLYFETACDDKIWMGSHLDFVKQSINWFTNQSFEDKLLDIYAERAASAIRKNHGYLSRFIPTNFIVKHAELEEPVNTLLLSTLSETFKEGFLRSREKKLKFFALPRLSRSDFHDIYEFACSGVVANLWKQNEVKLLETADLAAAYGIIGIIEQSQEMMKKFVNTENMIEKLTLAQSKGWSILKGKCLEVVNEQGWGLSLSAPSLSRIAVRFEDFSSLTIEHFMNLAKLVTDIACAGEFVNSPGFSKVMSLCPKLYGVNLSGSTSYMDVFSSIPKGVKLLNLTQCSFLNTKVLKQFTAICPVLEELILSNNIQLDFSTWGDLLKFKELKVLDISGCNQVRDEDLKIILRACGKLLNLNLSECMHITEDGFFDLARSVPFLAYLNLTRTRITDTSLVEIGVKCLNILSLNLTKCDELTEKGIIALIKQTRSLEELIVLQLPFITGILEEIRRLKPRLKVVL